VNTRTTHLHLIQFQYNGLYMLQGMAKLTFSTIVIVVVKVTKNPDSNQYRVAINSELFVFSPFLNCSFLFFPFHATFTLINGS
jgi:hypothetical protein